MQAAALLKEKTHLEDGLSETARKVKVHRPMAKPVLVATITQDHSRQATVIKEDKNGMGWITTRVKLPTGKNAWGGKAGDRRKVTEAQKRWLTRNKVGDGGAGGPEKSSDGRYRQTGVVNIVLYVGLGLIALGLIITFVGTGEHGFKSRELKLIGPSLIGCGVLFCLLRLFFCSAPATCPCCRSKPLDEKSLLSPSRETMQEEVGDGQAQQQRVMQVQPQLAEEHEEQQQVFKKKQPEDNPPEATRISSNKSMREAPSSIPNFIEDEVEDDAALGLHVEYMDEVSNMDTPRQRPPGSLMPSRPGSSHSQGSTGSKVPRLPDIHTKDKELVLDPAALERGVD